MFDFVHYSGGIHTAMHCGYIVLVKIGLCRRYSVLVVKRHLKATHIAIDTWEALAQDRQWRQAIHKGKSHIEENISQTYQHDHNLRHGFPASTPIISCVNYGERERERGGGGRGR